MGYEGLYDVSNYGIIKSLAREWKCGKGYTARKDETILATTLDNYGYLAIGFNHKGKNETSQIHRVVWDAFGDKPRNGSKLQVDHIDNNKLNNRIDNLQLLTNRQNTSKGFMIKNTSSKYTGVSWVNRDKIWRAHIRINKKLKHLGHFKNEYDAHLAYQKALGELNEDQ